jgi:2-C-methyl-D-erythritol 4-phosphate cytidylyltransferase
MSEDSLRWGAVIVAAGRGTRFGAPKQLIDIAGAPMVRWSVRTFRSMPEVLDVVVVTEAACLGDVAAAADGCIVVPGGATRQASVFEGLNALPERCSAVLIHDGARPLIEAADVRRGMAPVGPHEAALLARRIVDTVKAVAKNGLVKRTLDRNVLWTAQTPQFAMLRDMRRAHEAGMRERVDATDDAMLLERIGVRVHVVEGSPDNFKVTLPEDRARAERVLLAR